MKRQLALIVLAGTAIGGVVYYRTASAVATTAPQVLEQAVSVGTIVEAVQSTGTLGPVQTVNIGSQVSGVVSNLYADFNDVVKKGQVIATLDPALLQVQVDLQEANLERQKGEIGNQETQLENDRKTLERLTMMFDKGLSNRQDLEKAQVQVKIRESQLDAARKVLLTNQAMVDQAKLNVSYTTIRSPIDGVVVNRLVDTGQTVQSSLNVAQFFSLATDLRKLRLQATVDEAEIGRIRPGMPVVFTVDAYGSDTFTGTVDTVNLNATNQSNVVTYPVWIDVDNPDLKLRPSMTANLRIIVSRATQVTRIPNAAYRFRPTADIYRALGLTPPAAQPARSAVTPAATAEPSKNAAESRSQTSARPAARPGAATKVDELFAPVERPITRATVWTWDAPNKKLSEVSVRLGTTDGQQSELLDGDLKAGQRVVTSVIVPLTSTPAQQQNVIGGMGGRGGPGGPGGFAGGGRGF